MDTSVVARAGERGAGDGEARARVPVLLVAGSGRSGSTLLSRILAGVEGAFFGGEIRYVFQRGLLDNRLCGCHEAFLACPLWTSVLEAAYGGPGGIDASAVIDASRPVLRARHLHRNLLLRRTARQQGAGAYVEHLERLYPAIQAVTGCRFVVDSSKLPAYGNVLGQLDGVDLYVVHLVRDPRAAAWSWLREKEAPDRADGLMEQRGALKSAALWNVWNWSAGTLGRRAPQRYLRLRYEDFLADPRASVGAILGMLGLGDAALPFLDTSGPAAPFLDTSGPAAPFLDTSGPAAPFLDTSGPAAPFLDTSGPAAPFLDRSWPAAPFLDERTVVLGADHSVAGNPDRLTSGPVTLRAGGDWLAKLPARDRILTSAVTSPLLLRYGYPLRATRSAGTRPAPPESEAS